MKLCYICKCEKNEEDFLFRNKSKGTRHKSCKDCYKITRKKSYEANKSYYIEKSKRRRIEISDWFFNIKSNLKCELCGFSHVACLDFHHTNNDKEMEVSKLVSNGSKKKILDEINKCIVLCSNCHRIHHFNERNQN
jgi:hypothetical protein